MIKRKVNLILIRHGETEDNVSDILMGHNDSPLTISGKKITKKVAKNLKKEKIDYLYCSPLGRAIKTAQIILKDLGYLSLNIENLLIERDFGVLNGKHKDEMSKYTSKILKTDQVDYFLGVKDSETLPHLLKRAHKLIKKMEEKYPFKTVLLVTHGDIGKMIQAAYYGWDWQKGLKAPYFAHDTILKLNKK